MVVSNPLDVRAKNECIKAARQATRNKRQTQSCRVYQLKIDQSHLSRSAIKHLTLLFLQAKWFVNAILASDTIFEFDSKVKTVAVKVGETYENRALTLLSSQMKQGLLNQVQQDVRNLARKKAKGQKVGRIKFKKSVQTIPLKQYGNTYNIQLIHHRVRIQGLKPWLRVRGLDQLPDEVEFANAQLITRHGDFFVHVTTYVPNQPRAVPNQSIGIDFGIKHQLTTSTAIQINYELLIPKRIRRLHQKLSKKQRGSQNYVKVKQALQKEYTKWRNRKKDVTNKLSSLLTTHYQYVCFQADPIANWQRVWGSRTINTNLGALLTNLKQRSVTPGVVDPWTATTKRCSVCGFVMEQPLDLATRTFRCPTCGFVGHRDVNAARCIEQICINTFSHLCHELPAECRNVKPPEISTATRMFVELLNQIPYVRASVVNERGSPIASM